MSKKACHSELVSETNKGGESLPLARTSSLATPSSGGHPRNAPVNTTIEAPYELPEGWKWERLGNYISLLRGVSYKKEAAHSEKLKNDCLIIRGGNIVEGSINLESDNIYVDKSLVSENQLIKKNDIIIVTSTGSTKVIGRAGVSKDNYKDVAFGAFLTLARPNDLANKSYINHYFQSSLYRERIRQLASGVNINNIRTDYITETPIPLPPTLTEQERIVNRIETMFAKLDQAQEKAQSVLDSFEPRKAAILHKAFTGQLKIDNEELIIEDWEEKSFSELGTTNLGKMLDANKNIGDDVQYLRNINVRWFDFDLSDLMTMKAKPEEIKKLSVKKGDLFICEGGEPGRCAVWKDENADLIFQKAIHRFRPNDGVSSDFVAYVLYYYNQIGKLSDYFTGTTIKHLTGQSLAKLPIKLPPLNYQLSIVNFLDTVLEKETRAKEAVQSVLDQIALLKKSILARAFRGEL